MSNNSRATAKKPTNKGRKQRGKGKPFTKGDPRINRNGAPPKGSSMAEVLKFYDDLTPEELIERFIPAGKLRNRYGRQPKTLAVKHIRALAALIELAEKPSATLASYIDDRIDGKVADKINVDGTLEIENLEKFIKEVYGNKEKADKES